MGQVGQESNLQPAVLEPRFRQFMGVHAMSLHVANSASCRGRIGRQVSLPVGLEAVKD